jgi:hypothetical protein
MTSRDLHTRAAARIPPKPMPIQEIAQNHSPPITLILASVFSHSIHRPLTSCSQSLAWSFLILMYRLTMYANRLRPSLLLLVSNIRNPRHAGLPGHPTGDSRQPESRTIGY